MKRICWIEPGDNDEPVVHRITPQEALERMARWRVKHPEATDEIALDTFKVIHWAWEEEDGKP